MVSLGGLHIIGTERHESRRIDNQLRGRAGRQGDPGSTRFYVSLEDDLMRRFGADRISGVMEKLNPDDDVPIEAKIISKQIESAQKRVESSNFEIRKNVLRYDDVINKQREIIYGQRRRVLMGEDVHDSILDMLHSSLDSILDTFASSHAPSDAWDLTALSNEVCDLCFIPREPLFSKEEILSMRHEDVRARIYEIADKRYQEKEQEITTEGGDMREVERVVLLRTVD